jgi:hypothetical protein
MAVPRSAHFRARQSAAHHVQVELIEVGPLERPADRVRVKGYARRVFRSDPTIREGDVVSFTVGVFRQLNSIPSDAGGWIASDEVTPSRLMEVYLNGIAPECETALVEYTLIDGPSQDPMLPTPTEEEMRYIDRDERFTSPDSFSAAHFLAVIGGILLFHAFISFEAWAAWVGAVLVAPLIVRKVARSR